LLYTAFGMHLASLAPLVAVIEPDLGMSHAAMGAVLGAWLPELLRATGMDLTRASLLATVPVAVAILSALTVPRLATDQRRTHVLVALFLCSALGSGLLLAGQGLALIGGLVFAGIAWGAMMTVLILVLVEIPGVGERRAGTAGGLFFSVAEIGGVGGPVLLGLLYDRSGGFASSLWLLVLIALLLMVAVAPLRRYLGGSQH
jgi:cyanate permease